MGYFSNLMIEMMENLGPEDPNEGITSFATNKYEEALEKAEERIGKSNFYKSCLSFYTRNGFLTDKQIYALKNPRY